MLTEGPPPVPASSLSRDEPLHDASTSRFTYAARRLARAGFTATGATLTSRADQGALFFTESARTVSAAPADNCRCCGSGS